MSIGTRIKEARRDRKLTQKQLADKVGIKQPTLLELENGDLTGTTLIASFAAALGVNALWLETGKGDKLAPLELKRVVAVDENSKTFIGYPIFHAVILTIDSPTIHSASTSEISTANGGATGSAPEDRSESCLSRIGILNTTRPSFSGRATAFRKTLLP